MPRLLCWAGPAQAGHPRLRAPQLWPLPQHHQETPAALGPLSLSSCPCVSHRLLQKPPGHPANPEETQAEPVGRRR